MPDAIAGQQLINLQRNLPPHQWPLIRIVISDLGGHDFFRRNKTCGTMFYEIDDPRVKALRRRGRAAGRRSLLMLKGW